MYAAHLGRIRILVEGGILKNSTHNRIIVIGGGAAGILAAGTAAAAGAEVLVLEKMPRTLLKVG
ncbi:MAG: NAD(P)/FAD-dependent oxidoreductase, partial [Desulfuromonadaceae bacterium]|nr:NAD(P)/FAD-dependent oxidoreductase [Desulfuromonadaceae bacterium]